MPQLWHFPDMATPFGVAATGTIEYEQWTIVNGWIDQMRIGELAQKAGVSRDTIRFYERQGLIMSEDSPAATNSYRSYPEDTLLTLDLIAEAQMAGFTIADLCIFLGELTGRDDGFDGLAFLDAKIAEVQARIARSKRFLATLRQTRIALEHSPLG
jgi:DNA-binding transcriptional MerR regulator